jgi:hyperosmotically inducible protein
MRSTGVQWPVKMISKISAALLVLLALQTVCLAKDPPPVTDDTIYDQVRLKLASDMIVKGGALQVAVKQGVVTLSGDVEQDKQKERAEKIAKKVKGVKQVVNHIEIKSRNAGK